MPPQYASFNPTAAAPAPVLGWYDTGVAAYPNLPPAANLLALTPAQWAARLMTGQWAVSAGTLVPYTPPAPVLTVAQQAQAALSAGLTVTSASLGLAAVAFAVDDNAQNRLARMQSLIQAAGGVFPAGVSSLLWVDKAGATHALMTVAQFNALGGALGSYALALEEIIATGAGALPASTITIA